MLAYLHGPFACYHSTVVIRNWDNKKNEARTQKVFKAPVAGAFKIWPNRQALAIAAWGLSLASPNHSYISPIHLYHLIPPLQLTRYAPFDLFLGLCNAQAVLLQWTLNFRSVPATKGQSVRWEWTIRILSLTFWDSDILHGLTARARQFWKRLLSRKG